MKKLVLMFVVLIAINAQAQNQKKELKERNAKDKKEFLKDLTPEEVATLMTKKMTLRLDLSEAQQKQVKKLNLEKAKQRNEIRELRKTRMENENATKPSNEERLKMMNKRLDYQIATKEKMKSILTDVQYEKWEKSIKMKTMKKRKHGKSEKRKKINK